MASSLPIDLAGTPILTILLAVPLIGAILLAFIPGQNVQAIRRVALLTALIAFVVSLVAVLGFRVHESGFQLTEKVSWIPFLGINYELGVDGISLILVVLTTLLSWISILDRKSTRLNSSH